MRKHEKIFPVILTIWPYLLFLFLIVPDKTGKNHMMFLTIYTIVTIIIYGFNIWNAFAFRGTEEKLAFYGMMVKLFHIPFYLAGFAAGILCLFVMVVPAFLLISPILILILAAAEYLLMIVSSSYGISGALRVRKKQKLSKASAVVYLITHCIFAADVISSVCLYRKIKNVS